MNASIWTLWSILVVLFLNAGCDGPKLRTAPTAQPSQHVASPGKETGDSAEPEIEKIDIPSPSGKLLTIATSATVRITGEGFQGSGVIVHHENERIYVLTVAHSLRFGKPSKIELFSPHPPKIALEVEEIEVLNADDRSDLAILRAPVGPSFEVTVAKLADLAEPEYAYSSGCVGRSPPKIYTEQILRADNLAIRLLGKKTERFMWETLRPQESGRSGGPLLNDKGFLLGIALGKSGGKGYYAHLREISKYFIDNGLEVLVTCSELLSIHQERM